MKKKNEEIQILRAFAISLALVEHTSVVSLDFFTKIKGIFGYWSGIEIFFAISGFLIARSLTPLFASDGEINKTQFIKSYFLRRVFRIFPVAWVWIIGFFALSEIARSLGSTYFSTREIALNDMLAASLNYANIYWGRCWQDGLLGISCGAPALLSHYWSLSLEEQFYFLLPFIFLACKKPWIVKVLMVMTFLILMTTVRYPVSFGWFNRIDALCLGVLLALITLKTPDTNPTTTLAGRFIFYMLMITMMLTTGILAEKYLIIGGITPPYLSFLAILGAIIVYLASIEKTLIWVPEALRRPVLWLGERSYSVYACHLPIFGMAHVIFERLGIDSIFFLLCAAFASTFIAAEITYRLVEIPFMKKGIELSGRISR